MHGGGIRRRALLGAAAGSGLAGFLLGAGHRRAAAATLAGPGPHDREINALLAEMTLEEKLGQLQQLEWSPYTGPGGNDHHAVEEAARSGRLGAVLTIFGAKTTNTLQKIAVEESRLGIPLVFGLDVIHGMWTTFPIPLAQAASFDPEVAAKGAEVAAGEARSSGVHWTFSPMMDVTHEPRWGRVAESNGEDPYLAERIATATIRAYQGTDFAAADRVAACAKHFVGYGAVEAGRDYNTVDLSESRLRNLHLPPFEAAVEAGVATVMAAFNTVSGVPAHGNAHTLTEILKQEWGFGGVVVSDYQAVAELVAHGFAADGANAAEQAVTAGIDIEMTSTNITQHGADLVHAGRITTQRLDDAVHRILDLKFRLGLFERPYVDESAEITEPNHDTRAAARAAGARTMVLLKNDEETLPLSGSVSSVAVIGPFAASGDLLGTWTVPTVAEKFPSVTVLDAIRDAVPKATVTHAEGVDPFGEDTSGIAAAVTAANAAEAIVVVVGEPASLSGENNSRSDISLPGAQEELVEAIAETGKPFVVVLVNGRPLVVSSWVDRATAVLEAWQPGIEAGNAIADVLFGAINPGGKLPASFPRSVGQIPVHHNHENSGRPSLSAKYLDLPPGPQFAFGFGLSYTRFSLDDPELDRATISAEALRGGETVEVSIPVRNSGKRAGDEVVQLYVHDLVASITQPVRRLRGFHRVTLDPGHSTTVRFRLGAADLGFWTNAEEGRFLIEPGSFDLHIGTSSEANTKLTLTVD